MKTRKKIVYVFLLCCIALISCNKETNISLPTIDNVTFQEGYGDITFMWNFPENKNIDHVRVDFMDNDEKKYYTFSRFTKEAIVSGLKSKEYQFIIRTADKSGNLSEPIQIKATPQNPVYVVVGETINAKPIIGGIAVSWKNDTGKEVQINVEYVNNESIRQIFTVVSADKEGSAVVANVPFEKQEISMYASNPSNYKQTSTIKTVAVKPYQEIRFEDKNKWVVVEADSDDGSHFPSLLFDDDLSTFWQTNWRAGHKFPHHVTFDMGSERVVSALGFYNRDHNNANNAMKDFTIEGSLDGENWITYGSFDDFPTTRREEIKYALAQTPTVRYIRITGLTARNNVIYLALAEIYVYGAFL